MKKVLITGDRGYIGTVLVDELIKKNYEVVGLDAAYFEECELVKEKNIYKKITKDIRDIEEEDIEGVEYVIHLAGLSNDPLGELKPGITEEVNFKATVRFAEICKKVKVKRFIFASSQSIYGISESNEELKEDEENKNPITSYAKSKWLSEIEIKKLNDQNFTTVCFRPATVFGASPRLRCDIVFNNLVACAYTTKIIEIKSDGTPWRPIIHVKDVCAALIAGIEAPVELISGKSYNVGIKGGNFTVRQIAEAAQMAVPGSILKFTNEHGKDSRTYKVCFDKIYKDLGEFYKPKYDLKMGGEELIKLFEEVNFSEESFRGRKTNRLTQINYLQKIGKLNEEMR